MASPDSNGRGNDRSARAGAPVFRVLARPRGLWAITGVLSGLGRGSRTPEGDRDRWVTLPVIPPHCLPG